MAKKNPASAEWLSRCVDITASITDGYKEKDEQSGYTIFISVPPYSDLGKEGNDFNLLSNEAIMKIFNKTFPDMTMLVSDKGLPTCLYSIYGHGTYKEMEDMILKNYQAMSGILGESVSKWISKLESSRPSASGEIKPLEYMSNLLKYKDKLGDYPALLAAMEETEKDPYCIKTLNVLSERRQGQTTTEIICERLQDNGLKAAISETVDGLNTYKNTMRQKSEIWLARAFAPLSAPYMAPLFKNNTGQAPIFRDMQDYYNKLADKVFSDDFAGSAKMSLEATGIMNSQMFHVSPYRVHITPPSAKANGKEVVVKTNWMHNRLHWKLLNNIEHMLNAKYQGIQVKDSRDNSKGRQKRPDPYGLDTMFTKTLYIPLNNSGEAEALSKGLQKVFDALYVNPNIELSQPLTTTVSKLREMSDLVSVQVKNEQEAEESRMKNIKIEDRIMPYAAGACVYIQIDGSKGGKLPKELYEAINETIAEHPGWTADAANGSYSAYLSIKLRSSFQGEGAGLAERYMVANEIAKRYQEKAGDDRFKVTDPDEGFTVEAYKRFINPKDKDDKTEGLYIKIPTVFAAGGVLDTKAIEDESVIDSLDPVSRGFFDLGEEFGRAASRRSLFKMFVPASSTMESYTRTFMYKLKPEDGPQKEAEIKALLENRIAELFPERTNVRINWMPDREAMKLEDVNKGIKSFKQQWTNLYNNTSQNQERLEQTGTDSEDNTKDEYSYEIAQ